MRSTLCATLMALMISNLCADKSFTVPPPSSYALLPAPVTSFGAVVHDGWLYTFGGYLGVQHEYSEDGVVGNLRRMNLREGIVWEELPNDVPTQSPGVWAKDNWLYRIGGMAARNTKDQEEDLHSHTSARRFNIKENKWEDLPDLPTARSSHDIMIVGDRLYAVGGWTLAGDSDDAVWLDTVEVLDLNNIEKGWTSIPQPFKRRALAVVALGSKIYCIGGMDDGDSMSGDVDVLNTTNGKWSKGLSLPLGRMKGFGAAACVTGGQVYVSPYTGKLWRLSNDGDAWEDAGELQQARFFHRMVANTDGQLLALGGTRNQGKLNDIEIIDLNPETTMNWPQFRGPTRDGVSRDSNWQAEWPMEGPPTAWRKELGAGLSSFAVVDGRVYTMGNAADIDTVWCLDAATGEEAWRFDYPCPKAAHKMPIVPGGPAATPAVVENRVFTLGREGQFFCLDANTGEVVWKTHLIDDLKGKRPVYGYANSALIANDVVFLDVGGTNGSTVALNAEDGSVRWRGGNGEAGYSSPRLLWYNNNPALAVFKGEALVLLDPNNGKELTCHVTTARDFCNTITPAIAGQRIIVSNTGKDGTACLDTHATTPAPIWQKNDFGMLFNSPIIWQGRLYGFNDANRSSNELTCLDLASGKTIWTFEDAGKGVFTMAGGKMLILSKTGELVALDPSGDEPRVLSRTQLFGGTSRTDPVLAGGFVFCRNNDGSAICLDLTKVTPESPQTVQFDQ